MLSTLMNELTKVPQPASSADGVRAGRGRVKSVEQGIQLMRVLARQRGPVSLKSAAAAAGMHPSKAHRYLVSLIASGMAEQVEGSGRYRLGPVALEIGLSALAQLDLVEQATPVMEKLRDQFNETLLLSIWSNNGATIVKMLEPPRPVTVNVRVGFSLPLLASATGLVFGAFLPQDQVAPVIAAELRLYEKGGRPDTPHDAGDAGRILAEVQRRGMSRVKGALLAGINSLGAPIFTHGGALAGVLTVLGSADEIDITWNGRLAAALKSAARDISIRLGHINPSTSGKL